jgi:hypothetical protein
MAAKRRDPNPNKDDPNDPTKDRLYGITWITDWLTAGGGANVETMLAAKNLNGGWEAWLQVVLSLNGPPAGLVAGYTLQREKRDVLQDPNLRIDVFMKRPPAAATPSFGIELKCRTATEGKTSFVNRVKKDMERIQDSTSTGLGLTNLYAVGITTEQEDLQGWADVNGTVNYWDVPGQAGGKIYVIWLGQQFNA